MKNTESTTRKRSRTSEDAEDAIVTSGGKKARGRPRVDTQDATAADVSDFFLGLSFSCNMEKLCSKTVQSAQNDILIHLSADERRSDLHNVLIGNAKRQRSLHSKNNAPSYTVSSMK